MWLIFTKLLVLKTYSVPTSNFEFYVCRTQSTISTLFTRALCFDYNRYDYFHSTCGSYYTYSLGQDVLPVSSRGLREGWRDSSGKQPQFCNRTFLSSLGSWSLMNWVETGQTNKICKFLFLFILRLLIGRTQAFFNLKIVQMQIRLSFHFTFCLGPKNVLFFNYGIFSVTVEGEV